MMQQCIHHCKIINQLWGYEPWSLYIYQFRDITVNLITTIIEDTLNDFLSKYSAETDSQILYLILWKALAVSWRVELQACLPCRHVVNMRQAGRCYHVACCHITHLIRSDEVQWRSSEGEQPSPSHKTSQHQNRQHGVATSTLGTISHRVVFCHFRIFISPLPDTRQNFWKMGYTSIWKKRELINRRTN